MTFVITNKDIKNGTFDKSIIPDGTTNIIIMGAESLTSLPNGFMVNGDFTITGCPNLNSLPKGLVVQGHINLAYCTGLPSNYINIRKLEVFEEALKEVYWPEHLSRGKLHLNTIYESTDTDSEQLNNSASPQHGTYRQYIQKKQQKLDKDDYTITSKIHSLGLKYNEITKDVNSHPNLLGQYKTDLRNIKNEIRELSTNKYYNPDYISCLNKLEKTAKKLSDFRPSPTSITNVSSLSPVPQSTPTHVILAPKPVKQTASSPLMGGGHVASLTIALNNQLTK